MNKSAYVELKSTDVYESCTEFLRANREYVERMRETMIAKKTAPVKILGLTIFKGHSREKAIKLMEEDIWSRFSRLQLRYVEYYTEVVSLKHACMMQQSQCAGNTIYVSSEMCGILAPYTQM